MVFNVNGKTRLPRTILVLLFFMATLVVPPGSGLFSAGFACIDAPRAVSLTIAFTHDGEVCTVFASADCFSLKTWTICVRSLVLQYFQLCAVSTRDFLGALDDREFFVVEGSGVAGSPGV